MNELISVVIPNYNSALYIVKTLDSVLGQTYRDFEIIIVDDRSTDASVKIIKKYIKKNPDIAISLICLNRNYGMPAGPRNIGVKNSNGKWIAFLDADDIWHPSKLEFQVLAINRKNSSFCSTKMIDFKDDSDIVFDSMPSVSVSNITFRQQLLKNRVPTSSVLVKKELMLKFKFNESKEYKAQEDGDCWMKIHENIDYSIKLNNNLLFYRLIEGQISGNKFKMMMKNYMVLEKYRFNDGSKIGLSRFYYFVTQILLAIYYRLIKKTL
jgi:teichuronic acid biosynthesis glycosyltransferase TuaG